MEDALVISEKATRCLKHERDKARSLSIRRVQKWLCISALVVLCLCKVLEAAGLGKRIEIKTDSATSTDSRNVQFDETDRIGGAIPIAETAGVCNQHVLQGNYAAAEKAHLEAFDRLENKKHKDFAIHLRMYADTLMHARKFEAAETIYRYALSILEQAVGTADKEYPMTMLKLAKACDQLGYFEEEQQLCNQARKLLGF